MNDHQIASIQDSLNRRVFLRQAGAGLGLTALGALFGNQTLADEKSKAAVLPAVSSSSRRDPTPIRVAAPVSKAASLVTNFRSARSPTAARMEWRAR